MDSARWGQNGRKSGLDEVDGPPPTRPLLRRLIVLTPGRSVGQEESIPIPYPLTKLMQHLQCDVRTSARVSEILHYCNWTHSLTYSLVMCVSCYVYCVTVYIVSPTGQRFEPRPDPVGKHICART